MFKIEVNAEAPFQVMADRFAIGQTTDTYTLQFSVDGTNWTDMDENAWTASTDRVVTGGVRGLFWKLKDNTKKVPVIW